MKRSSNHIVSPRNPWLGAWLVFAAAVAFCSTLWAEDTAYVQGEQPGDPDLKLLGDIVDYTGRNLAIKLATGNVRNIPGQRVLKIESTWTPAHLAGDKAFGAGEFRPALQQYTQALTADQRVWARRLILSQIVWCYRYLGDYETAGERFLALIGSDPTTPYFDAIPLQWTPSEAVSAAKANSWLAQRDKPAARLLGASHLLTSGQQMFPLDVLRVLARDEDPRIAGLATAQLWRSLIFSAEKADALRWEEQIAKMPVPLQAGPYYVLGQTLARLGESQLAVLALLRAPLLYPQQRDVAAEALLAAGGEFVKLGQAEEAARLYREVISSYPGTKAQAAASARLQKLAPEK